MQVAEGLGIYVNVDVDDDTSVVLGVSNLEEFNVNEDKENTNYPSTSPTDIISPLVPKKIALPKGMPKRSWVWNHFKPIMTNKEHASCVLCSENIFYGSSRSTGMLEHHIQRRHPKVHSDMLKAHSQEWLAKIGNGEDGATELTQSSMSGFVVACPTFESCLLKWMIKTYQPLRSCKSDEFRMMCKALKRRSPTIGSNWLSQWLKMEYHEVQAKLIVILKGQYFALTTDAWTSIAKVGYVTCTLHFIDHETWKLHSMVLGLYEKTGCSRAIDCVQYAKHQMQEYNLPYSRMTAVVTDTEATMVAAGRLFVEHSARANGTTKWHGCINHLLELFTGIAFTNAPETVGAMSACRSIVSFFDSSMQAMGKLLSKQQAGRAVKPIQDVTTRWWSTYSMVD